MTGPECYQEALRLAKKAADYQGAPLTSHVQAGQLFQTYALLALAAATALGHLKDGGPMDADRKAWVATASEHPGEQRRISEASLAKFEEAQR